MIVGIVDVTSMTAPCMKIRNPPVDLAVSGQSRNEESVKHMMGEFVWVSFPGLDM
jgi:hypothetical protein